jgi:hypothetical protein
MSYYLVSCIGLALILKYGSILKDYREHVTKDDEMLKELFKCSLCLGFWAGALHVPFMMICEWTINLKYMAMPFVAAATCWFADSLIQMIQAIDVLCMAKKKAITDSQSSEAKISEP